MDVLALHRPRRSRCGQLISWEDVASSEIYWDLLFANQLLEFVWMGLELVKGFQMI
jgi:hypothetical protein